MDIAERRLKVCELYRDGNDFREVGEQLGIGHVTAWRDWNHCLASFNERQDAAVRDWKYGLARERADLRERLWNALEQVDDDKLGPLAQALLKSHEVDARQLGLNAPEQIAVAGTIMSEEEAAGILEMDDV